MGTPRTTAQAFDYFYENAVKPSTAQLEDVRSKRASAERYLRAAFPPTSDLPLSRVILIGSADRGTHVRPVDDVDVMAEFLDKDHIFESYRYRSQDFLQRIRRALDAQTTISNIGARGQAVRLFYQSGAHVDIAPMFRWSSSGFALPSGDNRWITTDPEEQARWLSRRREVVGSESLTRMIRFAKTWNSAHGSRLSSYHVEVMVASTFSSLGNNRREALAKFFEWAPSHLDVADPSGHSGLLSSYLSYNSRTALQDRFRNAAARATNALLAEGRGDHEEAKRLWRLELGTGFSLA